jgi:hypothetical protein
MNIIILKSHFGHRITDDRRLKLAEMCFERRQVTFFWCSFELRGRRIGLEDNIFIQENCMIAGVFMVVTTKICGFWDAMWYSLAKVYWQLGGTYCIHLQGIMFPFFGISSYDLHWFEQYNTLKSEFKCLFSFLLENMKYYYACFLPG